MSDRIKALREKRGKIVATMRGLVSKSESEKREMTPEETKQHDGLYLETETMRGQITAEERQVELDRESAAAAESGQRAAAAARGGSEGEMRTAWDRLVADSPAYLRSHLGRLDPVRESRMATAFGTYLARGVFSGVGVEELRALEAQTDTEGGFLVAPQQFVAQLIKFVDDMVYARSNSTVIPVPSASSLGAVSLDADVDDGDWTSEIATGNEDNGLKFGGRELRPHPLAKRVKVSQKLLRQAALNPETIVRDRLGYKFAVTEEKAFLLGTGAMQPLGVYVANGDGITTGRDVSTGNTTTAVTFDGLIEAKYSLKAQYWRNARWNFHRDAMKMISKLKDSNGQYLWRPSVREGEPDRILDFPFDVSEFAPNTFTTGLYVGLLGDWTHYWIADALDMQLQRLTELYAETNQIGFIARKETDGMPVLEEAFARVTLA